MTVAAVPKPMAADGRVAHDPMSQSLLVKPSKAAGYAWLLWRRGHREMVEAVEDGRYYDAPTI